MLRKHVLQIVANGDPGGGTTHVLQILRGLHERFEMTLVTQGDSYLHREAARSGVPCFPLDFFRSRVNLAIALQLRSLVSRLNPDLVHVHGGRAGLLYALAGTNTSTTYTVHGFHFVGKNLLMRWLALAAERYASKQADRIIFVSRHDLRLAKTYGLGSEQKSRRILNGIPLGGTPLADRIEKRHIGFIGRMEYQKDPLLFLEVMEHLPAYTATMIGGGSLERKVRREIERKGLSNTVGFLGQLSHPETLKTLSTFDALVMTSRWEGLPMVVLEAMWAGVPVVAVNVSGLNETIEHGRSGLLVDRRSAGELAYGVVQVTRSPKLRGSIVEKGRSRVRSLFAQDRMLHELHHVYEDTLQYVGPEHELFPDYIYSRPA